MSLSDEALMNFDAPPVDRSSHEVLSGLVHVVVWLALFVLGILGLDWMSHGRTETDCVTVGDRQVCPWESQRLPQKPGLTEAVVVRFDWVLDQDGQHFPELYLPIVRTVLHRPYEASVNSQYPVRALPDQLPFDPLAAFDD